MSRRVGSLRVPDRTNRYAEVVLKTAESLIASKVGARLLPASPFLHSLSLKARIEMILESRFAAERFHEIDGCHSVARLAHCAVIRSDFVRRLLESAFGPIAATRQPWRQPPPARMMKQPRRRPRSRNRQ